MRLRCEILELREHCYSTIVSCNRSSICVVGAQNRETLRSAFLYKKTPDMDGSYFKTENQYTVLVLEIEIARRCLDHFCMLKISNMDYEKKYN